MSDLANLLKKVTFSIRIEHQILNKMNTLMPIILFILKK
jgi:hypothetical protein